MRLQPEIFTREGGKIYITGLNSIAIEIPDHVEDTKLLFDSAETEGLENVVLRLLGELAGSGNSIDDVVSTQMIWRSLVKVHASVLLGVLLVPMLERDSSTTSEIFQS